MSKNDNKELSAILEQLKKSYSGDADIDKPQADESDDDFQKMLTNYFSDDDSSKDIYKFTATDTDSDEARESEYSLADFEEFAVEEEPEEASVDEPVEEEFPKEEYIEEQVPEEAVTEEIVAEEFEEEIIEEEIIEEEIIEEDPVEEDSVEGEEFIGDEPEEFVDDKAIVDDVFAAMFPARNIEDTAVDEPCDEAACEIVESALEAQREPISKMFDLGDPDDSETDVSSVMDMPSPTDTYEFSAEDVILTETEHTAVLDVPEADEPIYEYTSEPLETVPEEKETIDDIIKNMDLDGEDELILDISAMLPECDDTVISLVDETEDTEEIGEADEQVYLSDPLQGHLSDAAFVKYKIADDDVNFDVDAETPELDDEEISLLLDFGYDDEAEAEVGRERTNEIKRRSRLALSNVSDTRIYGYCGEEYTRRTQNTQIKGKYAKDKKELLIRTAIVFSVTLVLFFMSIVNCFGEDVNYLLYSFIELILLGAITAVSFEALKGGVVGIFKLEPNFYTPPAIVMATTLLYNLFSLIYVAASSTMIFDGTLLPCGFLAGMYVFASLLSDYFECLAESNAFEVLSDADNLYTAERVAKFSEDTSVSLKRTNKTLSVRRTFGDQTFEVRKTSMPSGYFGRMSQKQNRSLGGLYLTGAILALSLIIGCITLIKEGDISTAAYSSMVIILMGMPISFALVKSVPKLASSIALKQKSCAIVGDSSSAEYALAETLIFDDESAIEIVKKVEIRPEAGSDVASSMRVAARAFKALGGPIATLVSDKIIGNEDESIPEISLLSMRDNGIEFYMDSSIYMLIGDAAFMSTFGIRVSSDCDARFSSDSCGCNNVIYIAIDGVPKLGYIIRSKVKEDFISLVCELDKYGIKTAVSSYDPTINDYYFEQNKPHGASTISTYRPEHFYVRLAQSVADGGIFSTGDPKDIIYPLVEARRLDRVKKNNRIINYLTSILGCILSSLLVFFALHGNESGALSFVTLILILLFQLISALPIVLTSFDLKKKRKRDSN